MDASDIRGMDDLDNLIEAARCLGLVQARKAFGQYGPDDAAREHGLHASVSEKITRLRAEAESLKAENARIDAALLDWIHANGPNGWIDLLRHELAATTTEVEALRADAEKKDALLVRAHDMLGCVGCSPEGASKDIRMAKELQRDIDAARAAQKAPCGECHLQPGERCDVCGAPAAQGERG